MLSDFKFQKAVIVITLSALVVADIALGIYSWKRASQQAAQSELMLLQRELKGLKADISRAREIQREIPAVQKDCERFERSLFPAASGYSSVTSDLNAIASKAGLRLEGKSFHPSEVKGRALIQVEIDTAVVGKYSDIVHFLNGLQRSPNMYSVEALSARSDAQGAGTSGLVSVSLQIKTYFRAA